MDRPEALHNDCYKYYTIEQIAAYYQVSKATVRTWIKANAIPFLKLGGVYRLKLADIEAVFKQNAGLVQPVIAAVAPVGAPAINPDQDV